MMLCIHCLQQWFGLSDLAAEEALFEMAIHHDFCGLTGTCWIPDRVSILQIINDKLSMQGLMLKSCTVVDTTLIATPTSTKNGDKDRDRDGERDPKMHKTKKGNQWHF